MSSNPIVQTPIHQSHSHFYDYIPDFPGLPAGETYDQRKHRIIEELKSFYISGRDWSKRKNKTK